MRNQKYSGTPGEGKRITHSGRKSEPRPCGQKRLPSRGFEADKRVHITCHPWPSENAGGNAPDNHRGNGLIVGPPGQVFQSREQRRERVRRHVRF